MADASIDVRMRSTPTRFGGRHSVFGFIPEGEFVSRKMTPEQFAEMKKVPGLIVEIGSVHEGAAGIDQALQEAGELLAAEKRAHAATKEELEKATADKQAAELAHGRTKGELEALRKTISGKR